MGRLKKIKENIYIQLFAAFFKLGLFTIGGGMAMIPLIQDIVVDKKKWMTEEEAVDCIAVSQGLPGVVAINMATYIGQYKKGFLGALVATAGVILPSFIIIIVVIKVLAGLGDNQYVDGALVGIKAAATGLIAYSGYKVGRQVLKKGVFQWVLALAAFGAVAYFGVSAVWTIAVGIGAGLVYTFIMKKRGESK